MSSTADISPAKEPEISEKKNGQHGQAKVVPVEARLKDLQNDTRSRSRLESISAYFTIAAAAFGLISDGCMYPDDSRSQKHAYTNI